MTQPPPVEQVLTDTQRLARTITEAATSIRRDWPHMLPVLAPAQRIGGGSHSAQITADDHDPTEADIDPLTRVVSLRRYALDLLNGWSRVVMEDRPVTKALPDGLDAGQMCAFLDRHADWISGHEAAKDCADELTEVARRVGQVVRPTRKEWISLGDCPLEVEFDPEAGPEVCGGKVRAWPSQITDQTAAERAAERLPNCRRCGTEATVDWWYRHMFADAEMSRLVTTDELIGIIAVRLEWCVTHDQLRQWKSRGKIEATSKDAKGRTLWEHEVVVQAIHEDIAKRRIAAVR